MLLPMAINSTNLSHTVGRSTSFCPSKISHQSIPMNDWSLYWDGELSSHYASFYTSQWGPITWTTRLRRSIPKHWQHWKHHAQENPIISEFLHYLYPCLVTLYVEAEKHLSGGIIALNYSGFVIHYHCQSLRLNRTLCMNMSKVDKNYFWEVKPPRCKHHSPQL